MAVNLKICQGCSLRDGQVCSVSGREVGLHARHGQCPRGFFPALTILEKVKHGAAGAAKALAGINPASPEDQARRKGLCEACDQAVFAAGLFLKCSLCGCAMALKIRNADEVCPRGKW